jgi:hypothetical protein
LLGALCAASACRSQPTSTTRPSESQLEDERKRVARGEDVGASLRAPEIIVDAAGLRVNEETLATAAKLPIERHVGVAPLFVHLRLLHEHWTRIHPGRELAGAPTVTFAPGVPGELALDVLGTVTSAGFHAAKVKVIGGGDVVALDLAGSEVEAFDVVTFAQNAPHTYEVTIWLARERCSLIMLTDSNVEPAKLPSVFQEHSLANDPRPNIDEQIAVTMLAQGTAQDLVTLLAKVMATPLMKALRPRLRFAWAPQACPSDGKFGHAR